MTFTRSPYGPIAKATPTDVQQPNSPAQQASTARLTLVAAHWRNLNTVQKSAWAKAAADYRRVEASSRKSYRLSGYGLYASLSSVWLNSRSNVGTPPSVPPSGEPAMPALTVVATATASVVKFHGSASCPVGFTVQFELQPLRNAARKPSKGGYRVAGFAPFQSEKANDVEFPVVPGAYAARYAFVESSTGRRSGFVSIPVSGVALALEEGGAAETADPTFALPKGRGQGAKKAA